MKLNLSTCLIALSLCFPGCGDDASPTQEAQDESKSQPTRDGGTDDDETPAADDGGSSGAANTAGATGGGATGGAATGGSATGGSATGGAATGGTSMPPVLARTKGIGRPCKIDSECEGGQTCRVDIVNYIGHGQCTVACTNAETCETAFGKETMCIGAEICVARCLTDADCPATTQCSSAGWCKRQGTGSGVPSCGGVATPCSLLSASQCSTALGCRDDSSCAGVSDSCYSQYASYSCRDVDGCTWSTSNSKCSGVSRSCSGYPGEVSCGGQPGCRWDDSCAGVTRTCSELTVSACVSQPGCSLKFD